MSDPVTYTAVLPIRQSAVAFVSKLLAAEGARRGTRHGRRALSCSRQAVMVLRWLLDATRLSQLAVDNQVSSSTADRYLHEASTCSPPARRACPVRCAPPRLPGTPTCTWMAR